MHRVGPSFRDKHAFIRSKHTVVDLSPCSSCSCIFQPEILPKMANKCPFLCHLVYLSKQSLFRIIGVIKRERKGNAVSALCARYVFPRESFMIFWKGFKVACS